jgi:hypothetical protein
MIIILAVAIVLLILLVNLNEKSGKLSNFFRDTLCKSCLDGEDDENEWKSVAVCLDKFFFFLFLVVIILFVAIFIILFTAL